MEARLAPKRRCLRIVSDSPRRADARRNRERLLAAAAAAFAAGGDASLEKVARDAGVGIAQGAPQGGDGVTYTLDVGRRR